jgi:hypothetical protein
MFVVWNHFRFLKILYFYITGNFNEISKSCNLQYFLKSSSYVLPPNLSSLIRPSKLILFFLHVKMYVLAVSTHSIQLYRIRSCVRRSVGIVPTPRRACLIHSILSLLSPLTVIWERLLFLKVVSVVYNNFRVLQFFLFYIIIKNINEVLRTWYWPYFLKISNLLQNDWSFHADRYA